MSDTKKFYVNNIDGFNAWAVAGTELPVGTEVKLRIFKVFPASVGTKGEQYEQTVGFSSYGIMVYITMPQLAMLTEAKRIKIDGTLKLTVTSPQFDDSLAPVASLDALLSLAGGK